MSALLERQFQFAEMLPGLLIKARELSFRVTLGEAYRTPEQAALNAKTRKGIAMSLHTDRLAIDLHLFTLGGRYLTSTDAHRSLGEWWESVGGTWGGRFGDGNHYSLAFRGRK